MNIHQFQPSHIESVLDLSEEFEDYIQSLSDLPREPLDVEKKRKMFHEYVFSESPAFSGYVAEIDNEIVGYAMYHYGFDPDEMQWKVIYLIDLFVSERARGKGIGRALIEELQSHEDSLWLYFWVWKKNLPAIEFYKKMWADWIDDVPFMKLMK